LISACFLEELDKFLGRDQTLIVARRLSSSAFCPDYILLYALVVKRLAVFKDAAGKSTS
jgi:hypothetical protein